jgi:predicted AAA+ superfamily ATPase
MDKATIKEILLGQKADLLAAQNKPFLERSILLEASIDQEEISVVTGVRRAGKSSLLEHFFQSNGHLDQLLYLNFEDPQLIEFAAADFAKLYEVWLELYPRAEARLAFFDEIQNVSGWERWMNFFSKQKRFKVYVTGSNSTLLSKELGTHLTGRQRSITIYPLSFAEVFESSKETLKISDVNNLTLEQRLELQDLLNGYLRLGGFPRAWMTKDTSILGEYYSNILGRDIVRRRKIRNPLAIERLGLVLMSDIGRKINKTKIAASIGLKNSDTVEKYISYFEEAFLGFQIRKFSPSVRKQLRNQTKFYAVDPALARRVGLARESSETFKFENLVLIELLRRGAKVFYWDTDTAEIDFVIETSSRQRHLLQVCWDLESASPLQANKTLERELNGFQAFSNEHSNLKIDAKYIVTFEKYEKSQIDDVQILPFKKWALEALPH